MIKISIISEHQMANIIRGNDSKPKANDRVVIVLPDDVRMDFVDKVGDTLIVHLSGPKGLATSRISTRPGFYHIPY